MILRRTASAFAALLIVGLAIAGCTSQKPTATVKSVSCSKGTAVITASKGSYRVADQCGIVVVQGNDLRIKTGSVGQLQIQGNGSTVTSATITALTLSGQSNHISGSRIDSLILSGNKNVITSVSAGKTATINGNDNRIVTGGTPSVDDNGTGNTVSPK